MKKHPRRRHKASSQMGVALMLVVSSLAVLTIIFYEMTYSVQVQSRLAYNFVDRIKAYYVAKAALKLGLVRINTYHQIQDMIGKNQSLPMAKMIPEELLNQIWEFPVIYPFPVPDEAMISLKEAIHSFQKEAKLEGTFDLTLSSESSKLNIHRLLINSLPPLTSVAPPGQPQGQQPPQTPPTSGGQTTTQPNQPPSHPEEEFRKVLEAHFDSLLAHERDKDPDFEHDYKIYTGKDLVDLLLYNMKPEIPGGAPFTKPSFPGINTFTPKEGPIFHISELHLLPGIDDRIYDIIAPTLTTYWTPSLNINRMDKKMFQGLFPSLTDDEVTEILKARDDPESGQPFASEEKFWESLGKTSLGPKVQELKAQFQKSGVSLSTQESLFKIDVRSKVGLAQVSLEAYAALAPTSPRTPASAAPGTSAASGNPTTPPGAQPPSGQAPPTSSSNSGSNSSNLAVKLLYWRWL